MKVVTEAEHSLVVAQAEHTAGVKNKWCWQWLERVVAILGFAEEFKVSQLFVKSEY